MSGLRHHARVEHHEAMGYRHDDVIAHAGDFGARDGDDAVMRTLQRPAGERVDGTAACDDAEIVMNILQRMLIRGRQLRAGKAEEFTVGGAEEFMRVEIISHFAARVRRAEHHDFA